MEQKIAAPYCCVLPSGNIKCSIFLQNISCNLLCSSIIVCLKVIPILVFVRRFLDENALIACSDEFQYIKSRLLTDADQLKAKQKAGILSIRANQDK